MLLEPSDKMKSQLGNFFVLGRRLKDLSVRQATKDLSSKMMEDEEEIRNRRPIGTLKNDPIFRAYRDFFWRCGIDPTKTRPASEALTRRVLHGRKLPSINTFVDALNLASMRTKIPFAAFDGDKIKGSFRLRFGRSGEAMKPIGSREPIHLEGNEPVISDDEKLIALYPHRDSDRTKITLETTSAWILSCGVPGIGLDILRKALDTCLKEVQTFCNGSICR